MVHGLNHVTPDTITELVMKVIQTSYLFGAANIFKWVFAELFAIWYYIHFIDTH